MSRKIQINKIISYFIQSTSTTTSLLSTKFNISLPTAQKIVNSLIKEKLILNEGTLDTNEGRPPSLYQLNPNAAFFIGVDITKNSLSIGIMNFIGNIIKQKKYNSYKYENNLKNLDLFCKNITDFISNLDIDKRLIKSIGINLTGRVNPQTGMAYNMFTFLAEESLSEFIQKKIKIPIFIENDTRAMLYAEKVKGKAKGKKDVILINVDWGLGSSILSNGEFIQGKSGFAGEFGHFAVFNNEVLCHCGKKGCLETEASGSAFYRVLFEAVRNGKQSILSKRILKNPEEITLNDIVEATNQEDILCIEIIEQIGLKLGKYIACLINLLNPEIIIITGALSKTGGYLLRPIETEVNKYTLNIVNNDSVITTTSLEDDRGILGACLIAREKTYK